MPRKPATRKPVPAEWISALTHWENAMKADGVTAVTVSQRLTCLHALARTVLTGPWATTTGQITVYLDGRGWQPPTRRNYVKAFRAFYRWAVETGHTPADPTLPIPLMLNDSQVAAIRARAAIIAEVPMTGPQALPVPEPWSAMFAEYRRWALAAGAPTTTVGTRLNHLRMTARALDPLTPAEVTTDDLIDWMAAKPWANETRRAIRASLRSFYGWAERSGRITPDPAAPLPRVKASYPLPRPVTEDAYSFALTIANPRERLMLRLSAEMGLRRAEVACVHSRDLVDTDTGRALVVHGKGAKRRVLPLPNTLALDLAACPPGYAFPGAHRGHLSAKWVGKLVREMLPVGVSMHQLRHRFATRAYAASRDLLTVQQVLGHSSPATTQRYVAIDDASMRAVVVAVAGLSAPLRNAPPR